LKPIPIHPPVATLSCARDRFGFYGAMRMFGGVYTHMITQYQVTDAEAYLQMARLADAGIIIISGD